MTSVTPRIGTPSRSSARRRRRRSGNCILGDVDNPVNGRHAPSGSYTRVARRFGSRMQRIRTASRHPHHLRASRLGIPMIDHGDRAPQDAIPERICGCRSKTRAVGRQAAGDRASSDGPCRWRAGTPGSRTSWRPRRRRCSPDRSCRPSTSTEILVGPGAHGAHRLGRQAPAVRRGDERPSDLRHAFDRRPHVAPELRKPPSPR